MEYTVITVDGKRQLRPEDGYVLPHEHLLIDQRAWWDGPGEAWSSDPPGCDVSPALFDSTRRRPLSTSRENLILSDWFVAGKELAYAQRSGCQLLVDLTAQGLDPMPHLARRAAQLAGVHLVIGVGRYVDGALTPDQRALPVDMLVETWLQFVREGLHGCLPGIIGEIGTSDVLTEAETRSLQAAASVQRETGLAINLHLPTYARAGHEALSVLDHAGANIARVILSHCDGAFDIPWVESLLSTGCFVEFDLFGNGSDCHMVGQPIANDDDRLKLVHRSCERGYTDRVLISQDICFRHALRRYGGWGYGHLGEAIFPRLNELVGEEAVWQITRVNPLRVLSVANEPRNASEAPTSETKI